LTEYTYRPFGRVKEGSIDLDLEWRDVERDGRDAKIWRGQKVGATDDGVWFRASLSETQMGTLGREPTMEDARRAVEKALRRKLREYTQQGTLPQTGDVVTVLASDFQAN